MYLAKTLLAPPRELHLVSSCGFESGLPEVNPQPDHSQKQRPAKHHVQSVFTRSLRCWLVLGTWCDGYEVHLLVHGCKSEACQFLPFGSERHQAYDDKHERADHEHENGIVQEIHVDQPSQSRTWGITTFSAQLKNKARCAQHKAGQQRGDRALGIQPGP